MTPLLLVLILMCWHSSRGLRNGRSYASNDYNKQHNMFGLFGGYVPCERGTCTTTQYCQQTGGDASGYCYLPQISGTGVCCSFREACGQSTSSEISFFRNPNFPQPNLGAINCAFTVNVKQGMCGIRVDFLEGMFASKVRDACAQDSVTILHYTQRQSGYNIPLCGFLQGTSTVIQVVQQSKVQVVVTVQSPETRWNIRLAQINCSSVRQPVIQGCGIANESPMITSAKDNEPHVMSQEMTSTTPVFFKAKKRTPQGWGESRILGGIETPNKFPWLAALYMDKNPLCGGSLITNDWVLTAGHCLVISGTPVPAPNVARYTVILGAYNIYAPQEMWRTVRSVSNIVQHPEYIAASNDIALLRLDQPVNYNYFVRPVCLPTKQDETYAGQKGIIAGWGYTSSNDTNPAPFLRSATVDILNNSFCSRLWTMERVVIGDSLLCAGLGSPATCRGDSGGPLVVKELPNLFYSVVAITSFGAPPFCGNMMLPDVWTRVTYYLDWIYLVLTNV